MTVKTTITINELMSDKEPRIWKPRAATIAGLNEREMIAAAVRRFYGARAFLWRDEGLRDQGIFGQICKPVSPKWGGGNSCITGPVEIRIQNV